MEGQVPEEFERYLTRDKGTYIFGRLRTARQFWFAVLQASAVIMAWVTTGYPLPFRGGVVPDFGGRWSPNSKGTTGPSAFGDREEFVDEAVAALLRNGAILGCERSFLRLISPLNVVEQNNKLRLIHNLSHLNSFLEFARFRFEDLRDVPQIFELGDWVFSIDLMSAYHHVMLHESAWPYMGFSWRGKFYYFRVLPFGLGPAPMVFAKITGVMVERWRSRGIKVLPYLDDFLGGAGAPDVARESAHVLLRDMHAAGWLVSASKVQLVVAQEIVHLGSVLDFKIGQYRLPEGRLARFRGLLAEVLGAGDRVPVKMVSRLAGMAQSFRVQLGPVVAFYTRQMYVVIESRTSWRQRVVVSEALRVEFRRWESLDFSEFWQMMWPSLRHYLAFREMYSDAGARGWGGCVLLPSGERLDARGYLTEEGRMQSSTWRELFAIFQVLRSVGHRLPRGSLVQWHTDSQNAARSMAKGGSANLEIHRVCLLIFELSVSLGLAFVWVWIPRSLNAWSDRLAGVFDKDDWMLHPDVFRVLDAEWGPHTIDRFASELNHQVGLFNSWSWCPGTGGVNAFAQGDWRVHNNWCNPPFWLIGRLILFLREVGVAASVVVPCWPRQPWWRLVCPDGRHLADYVLDVFRISAHPELFSSGEHSANERGCGMPGYTFFALRISFRQDEVHLRLRALRCLCPGGCSCGGRRRIPVVDVL